MDLSVIESYKVHVVRPKVQLTVSGVGGFGKVCGITCNGAPCVAKGLRRLLMETPSEAVSGDQSASLFTQLLKECVLHSKLRHPNIVQFIGVEYGNGPSKYDLLLVTERIDTDLSSCYESTPTSHSQSNSPFFVTCPQDCCISTPSTRPSSTVTSPQPTSSSHMIGEQR